MLKVGITGGIGSGKTTICKIFETLGIPIYYADARAKEIMHDNENVKQALLHLFGQEAYLSDGALNRPFISKKVFQNKSMLQQLNAIVHPAVLQDTINWFQTHQDKKYVLYEAAIMYESGSYKMLDKVITVFAPIEERIQRTIKRDNIDRKSVLDRMDKQLSEEEKMKKADYIIYNDHTQSLIEQVLATHNSLLELADIKN